MVPEAEAKRRNTGREVNSVSTHQFQRFKQQPLKKTRAATGQRESSMQNSITSGKSHRLSDNDNNFDQFYRNKGPKQQQWKRKGRELPDEVRNTGRKVSVVPTFQFQQKTRATTGQRESSKRNSNISGKSHRDNNNNFEQFYRNSAEAAAVEAKDTRTV